MLKKIPNIISTSRIFLAILFVVVMSMTFKNNFLIANMIFIIASVTDYFDGYFARKYNVVSDIGKIIDPLADKILVNSCYVFLTAYDMIPAWICIVIISRELIISSLRIFAADYNIILPANQFGKIKTILLIVIAAIYLEKLSLSKHNFGVLAKINPSLANYLFTANTWVLYITTAFTVISLYFYVNDFIKALGKRKKS